MRDIGGFALSLLLVCGWFVACTGSESSEDEDAVRGDFVDREFDHEDYGGTDGPDGLVTYSPFTAEETTELRENFSWEDMGPVPEVDNQGRITLYYTLLLVSSQEQRQMLDDSGFPWSYFPLFPQDHSEFPDDTTIIFEGDRHGTFAHAHLTGEAININRRLWLEGSEDQEPFEVIKVIEPPERYTTEEGWMDIDALLEDGFWLEPTGEE